jgi:hypothetical protein
MRYWAYFAAKVSIAGLVLWGLLAVLRHTLPAGAPPARAAAQQAPKSPPFVAPLNDQQMARALQRIKERQEYRHLVAPLNDGSDKLLFDVALMGWFLLCFLALFFIVRDQRYRCRVCLRRLRMPIETGSWGQMLELGRPQTEYICPYGHGSLTAHELQISGLANPEWTRRSDDMWEELFAAGKDSGDRR